MRLAVVGGVAAGTKAASRARRVDPELDIVLYQEEPDTSISECGLPYRLSGTVGSRDSLIARTPEEFGEKGIEARVLHRVERVDHERRVLTGRNLKTGEPFEEGYDRLLISTGARAKMPPFEGSELAGVFPLRFLTDSDAILEHIREHSPGRAAVVGGGYIGLEVAENLVSLGLEVTLVESAGHVAAAYGSEVAGKIQDHLAEKGVSVHTGQRVDGFSDGGHGDGQVRSISFEGREAPAELVIVGAGIEPVVELAEEAGAEIGVTGAIRVNERMETSLPGVWAAGDNVESSHLVGGAPTWAPLGDTANQMGRVAGTNAALADGDTPLEFPGVLGTGIFKVFDLGVAKTGLLESDAAEAGFSPVSATVEAGSSAGYYPGGQEVFLKLVADKDSGRVLGAETCGAQADKMVDICATALWGRLTVADLINLDLAYAPPFGPALSPVIQAATIISGKL
ncbi:FAD-dependent oxidoreductase [Rubrobacter aplysinae]|uniref:FAD-dependent oxidoreductase n=1 Tax=Rubrobacter aplysinae TaxID=909625 RepID=UPI00064B98C0|nr:FAD-dependent oxidoreductase [Rubrobacter aplysinae]